MIVTAGAQQALDLVARVLVDVGNAVRLEDPGYPSARGVFTASGARIVAGALDSEGLGLPADPSGRATAAGRVRHALTPVPD